MRWPGWSTRERTDKTDTCRAPIGSGRKVYSEPSRHSGSRQPWDNSRPARGPALEKPRWCPYERRRAAVAQLVEQRIRNAWVGGSNPFRGTICLFGSIRYRPKIVGNQRLWPLEPSGHVRWGAVASGKFGGIASPPPKCDTSSCRLPTLLFATQSPQESRTGSQMAVASTCLHAERLAPLAAEVPD